MMPNTTLPIPTTARVYKLRALTKELGKLTEHFYMLHTYVPTPNVKRNITVTRRRMVRVSEEIYAACKRPTATKKVS